MTPSRKTSLLRALRNEDGQVLITMVLSTILILGMSGLSMDLGRAYVSYRELQASTDAAALAGGFAMGQASASTTTVTTAVDQFSSATGGYNVNRDLPSATVKAVNFSCNSDYATEAPCNGGISCSASSTGCNVVQVVQTATVNTLFLRVLSMMHVNPTQSLTLNATATALMRGTAVQYNVAVILDSTGSMSSGDSGNCPNGTTKEQCALQGIQSLLSGLTPCGPGSTSSTCKSEFDSVAVFTFPNVVASTASNATTCTKNGPQGTPYSAPVIGSTWPSSFTSNQPNYQITSGFVDNYSSTNALGGSIVTTLANPLEIATGADAGKNCNGLTTPISGQGTYLPGAIYAAQSALVAEQKGNVGSENAIVLLTDGAANASNPLTNSSGTVLTSKTTPPLGTNGSYPSLTDQCQQAISAAQYAASNGTAFYVVAYDAQTTGCTSDAAGYTDPCTNLQKMALKANETSPYTPYAPNFYSDNSNNCKSSANPNLTLSQVFSHVAASFGRSRLIPN
jgi:Flp pilus assembly protein TadG